MKYIGQTIQPLEKRQSAHECSAKKGSKYYFHRALKKYGSKNFKWQIIDTATSFDELNIKEKKYIALYDARINGYNLTAGGRGIHGWKHSEQTKEKIRQQSIRRNSARHIVKYSKSKIGRIKVSKKFKGKKYIDLYGKEKTEIMINSKKRLYIEKYGSEKSAEIRQKISKNNKSTLESVKRKMSKSHKKRLDREGKRTDITDIGRDAMRNHMIGIKNPMYKAISKEVSESIIEEYLISRKVTADMQKKYKLSAYLIRRILKEKYV